jgi:mannose-1-phosphate guanylyltransferase
MITSIKKICFASIALFLISFSVNAQEIDISKTDIYCVVLAGGTGERLWPLSRKGKPKQFLSLIEEKTLLESTFDRLDGVVGVKHNWVVTTKELAPLVKSTMNGRVEHIVAESASRNTAPAILQTLLEISAINPNAYVVFLPADHYIPDTQAFAAAINTVIKHKDKTKVTLLGIQPLFPATGYGYIKKDASQTVDDQPSPVLGFFEKPSLDVAKCYLESGDMLWNAGIFCGHVHDFIDEYKTHAASLYDDMTQFMQGKTPYEQIANISIDYAVLEKSKNIWVLPVKFDWSDIGNLSTYLSIKNKTDKPQHSLIEIASKNNTVHSNSKKIIALIDISDLCIIETNDVLLVAPRSSAEKVKMVVELLKKDEQYTVHL